MMGADLHDLNGKVCVKLWMSYIVLRLTYGVEVVDVSDKLLVSLECFQRRSLWFIQHLPPGTCYPIIAWGKTYTRHYR